MMNNDKMFLLISYNKKMFFSNLKNIPCCFASCFLIIHEYFRSLESGVRFTKALFFNLSLR